MNDWPEDDEDYEREMKECAGDEEVELDRMEARYEEYLGRT